MENTTSLITEDTTIESPLSAEGSNSVLPSLNRSQAKIVNPASAESNALELAQQLAQQLAIGHKDWHRLQSNRPARAQEQTAIALVYLLSGNSEQALAHLQQATAWLDRSVSAPPCQR